VTATDERAADADPLDLALAWARRVGQIADYWTERKRTERDRGDSPGMARVEAGIAGAGQQQFEAAQMAAFLAQVALAEDVRRIADTLTVVPVESVDEAAAASAEAALADARATREHMARWAAGEDRHDGEDDEPVDDDREAYREPGQ
jgi:hypothetical protein